MKKSDAAKPQGKEDALPPPESWDDSTGVTFEEYVEMDEVVEVCGELSERDISAEVLNKKSVCLSNEEEEQDGAEDTTPVPTLTEALN